MQMPRHRKTQKQKKNVYHNLKRLCYYQQGQLTIPRVSLSTQRRTWLRSTVRSCRTLCQKMPKENIWTIKPSAIAYHSDFFYHDKSYLIKLLFIEYLMKMKFIEDWSLYIHPNDLQRAVTIEWVLAVWKSANLLGSTLLRWPQESQLPLKEAVTPLC